MKIENLTNPKFLYSTGEYPAVGDLVKTPICDALHCGSHKVLAVRHCSDTNYWSKQKTEWLEIDIEGEAEPISAHKLTLFKGGLDK